VRLKYVIKFVADMDRAIAFYERKLSLPLRFRSPYWSEFDTGETTLALHPATPEHAAGSVQIGFNVEDLDAFYARRHELEISFDLPPAIRFGTRLATFHDCEGAECRISS